MLGIRPPTSHHRLPDIDKLKIDFFFVHIDKRREKQKSREEFRSVECGKIEKKKFIEQNRTERFLRSIWKMYGATRAREDTTTTPFYANPPTDPSGEWCSKVQQN